MSPVELGSWTLTPNPPFSLLLKGLWQGPPEGITVRVGPGVGGREGAHLVRSALRAGTAWRGLVSCAGSKETETGRRGGRTRAAHSPPPTQAAGNKLCFGVPREPLNQQLSELKGTPELTEPPHFTEVKTQGSESLSKELKATQHGKAENWQEKPTSGCQPMAVSLHGYCRTVTSLRIFPCHGPPSLLYEDMGPQDPTLAVEDGTHVALPT